MAKFEFLGRLSDRFDRQLKTVIPTEINTIAAIRPWLNKKMNCEDFTHPSIRVILNGEIATDDDTVSDSDTLVFFPPVGGG